MQERWPPTSAWECHFERPVNAGSHGWAARGGLELQPILQSVVDTAARLCRAEQSMIYRLEGGVYRFAAAASAALQWLCLRRQTDERRLDYVVIGIFAFATKPFPIVCRARAVGK